MGGILATWRAAFLEALAKPKAFAIDVTFMIINNLTWVVMWTFLFRGTGTIRGWDLDQFLEMFAVVGVVFGLSFGAFRNVRNLGRMATNGELDAALTLPVDPLAYLSVRRVDAASIGDVVFGLGVFFIACDPTPVRTSVFLLVSLLGCVVLTSFLAFLGALSLHFGGRGEQQDIGFEAVTLFSFYPIDLFGGPAKLIMFTVLPAAFVSALPTRVLDHFDPMALLWITLAAVFFTVLARMTFTTGLRKYRSGSQWTAG